MCLRGRQPQSGVGIVRQATKAIRRRGVADHGQGPARRRPHSRRPSPIARDAGQGVNPQAVMPQATRKDGHDSRLHTCRLTHQRFDVHIRSGVRQFDGQPVLGKVVSGRQERVDRPAASQLAERADRAIAHRGISVPKQVREPGHGVGNSERAAQPGGAGPHLRVAIDQRVQKLDIQAGGGQGSCHAPVAHDPRTGPLEKGADRSRYRGGLGEELGSLDVEGNMRLAGQRGAENALDASGQTGARSAGSRASWMLDGAL